LIDNLFWYYWNLEILLHQRFHLIDILLILLELGDVVSEESAHQNEPTTYLELGDVVSPESPRIPILLENMILVELQESSLPI